jgi:putative aminopeptidase
LRKTQWLREFEGDGVKSSLKFLTLVFVFLIAAVGAWAQSAKDSRVSGALFQDLKEYVETPAIPGYEKALGTKIRAEVAPLHPQVDSMDNVTVTIGSGAPHRLIVAPMDEPGYVVSGITDEGYLRVQRLPQFGNLPTVEEDLYAAQPVRVESLDGRWIYGVVAGHSVHLEGHTTEDRKPSDMEEMYVDVGASSKEEARRIGGDFLGEVTLDRNLVGMGHFASGYAVGDRFGAAALVELLRSLDASKVKGTLTVAFVVQQWVGGRGLQRVIQKINPDEVVYVGRLAASGAIAGMKTVRRAPRREMGSGVLIGMAEVGESLTGYPAELEQSAELNKITMVTDYAAPVVPTTGFYPMKLPGRFCHIGIATAWPGTPAEMIDSADLAALTRFLKGFAEGATGAAEGPIPNQAASIPESLQAVPVSGNKSTTLLQRLTETYGVGGHEEAVREEVKRELGTDVHPETDAAGNLVLKLGAAANGPSGSSPRILFVAHMDEIGFQVKSISKDGRLEVQWRGSGDISFFLGHPAIVHSSGGEHNAIMELPDAWDQPAFVWPLDPQGAIRVDMGARSPEEVAKMGVAVGDWITIPKKYRQLAGTKANGRSFDDRVGCAALIAAVKSAAPVLKDRDVIFAWSTGEEGGLLGAIALAKELNSEGKIPDYVFAVDTFVSSDSPIESQRFADAELGKGFVIRAIDNSNIAPPDLVDKLIGIAKARKIPVQYGVTGGGNDGSVYPRYGSIDIALGWPLRYSHSPAEVIDTRDLDALSRIVAEIAKTW